MKLSEELKHWGYHSSISDEGKKQHLEMAKKAEQLEAEFDKLVRYVRVLAPNVTGDLETLSVKNWLITEKLQEALQALSDETRKRIETGTKGA